MKRSLVRNIGIIAHIDAGKTTLTERILFYADREHRMGEVHEGTARMDYLAEERERGITITSAATCLPWKGQRIHLIDTPGHVDFTVEVERSLRVLDGAVVVLCGVAGVQAQSETVWRQADSYRVPRLIFVNKLDRTGADFERVVEDARRTLGARVAPVQIPWGREKELRGAIDLIARRALRFPEEQLGRQVVVEDVPEELREQAEHARHELFELLADADDAFAEAFLEHEDAVAPELVRAALRRATLAARIVPAFAGAAFRNVGVQPLLDGVLDYLPAPDEVPPASGTHPADGRPLTRACDVRGPLCGLLFKTLWDARGDLAFLRLYSGRLEVGLQVWNPRLGRAERITRLYLMHADQREAIESAEAGDIVAVVGLKASATGDTLCDKGDPIVLEGMSVPEPVLSMSIEPHSLKDKDELERVLGLLARDDPSFSWSVDGETGEMLIRGVGELHLEVLRHRIERDFAMKIRVGEPRVAYRQTIGQPAEARAVFDKALPGRTMYAEVALRLTPEPGTQGVLVDDELPVEQVPTIYHAAIVASCRGAASAGGDIGYPLHGLRVTLTGGAAREQGSNETAFAHAAHMAFEEALAGARPTLLEPVMSFEVRCPAEFLNGVNGDLNARRARIRSLRTESDPVAITGVIPLVETFGYSTALRSLTQGRATFTVQPCGYEPVPAHLARPLGGG